MQSVFYPQKLQELAPNYVRIRAPKIDREQRGVLIDFSAKKLPERVSIAQLCEHLDISNRTLAVYRAIAYEYVDAYWQSCDRRFPEYVQLKIQQAQKDKLGIPYRPVQPDPSPFSRAEAHILCKVAKLFVEKKSKEAVIEHIKANPEFWVKG
ncbi:MAG: hypothetical protein ACREPR_14990 [Brasilonema sp.]